jgi:hypothetical protein
MEVDNTPMTLQTVGTVWSSNNGNNVFGLGVRADFGESRL